MILPLMLEQLHDDAANARRCWRLSPHSLAALAHPGACDGTPIAVFENLLAHAVIGDQMLVLQRCVALGASYQVPG